MNAEALALWLTLGLMLAGGIAVWASRAMSGAAALKKVEALERDFNAFKEAAAREFVTVAAVNAFETRMAAAFERLGDRIDRLWERGSVASRSRTPTK